MEGDGLDEGMRGIAVEKLNLNVMLIATRNLCNSEFMKRSTALQSASYRNAQSLVARCFTNSIHAIQSQWNQLRFSECK